MATLEDIAKRQAEAEKNLATADKELKEAAEALRIATSKLDSIVLEMDAKCSGRTSIHDVKQYIASETEQRAKRARAQGSAL